ENRSSSYQRFRVKSRYLSDPGCARDFCFHAKAEVNRGPSAEQAHDGEVDLAVLPLNPGRHDPVPSVNRHGCGRVQPLTRGSLGHGATDNHPTVSPEAAIDMTMRGEAGKGGAERSAGQDYAAAGIDRRGVRGCALDPVLVEFDRRGPAV